MTTRSSFLVACVATSFLFSLPLASQGQTTGKFTYTFTNVRIVITQEYFDRESRYFRVVAGAEELAVLSSGGTSWPSTETPLPAALRDLYVVQDSPEFLDRFARQSESCERMALIAQASPESYGLTLQLDAVDPSRVTIVGDRVTVYLSTGRWRCQLGR